MQNKNDEILGGVANTNRNNDKVPGGITTNNHGSKSIVTSGMVSKCHDQQSNVSSISIHPNSKNKASKQVIY